MQQGFLITDQKLYSYEDLHNTKLLNFPNEISTTNLFEIFTYVYNNVLNNYDVFLAKKADVCVLRRSLNHQINPFVYFGKYGHSFKDLLKTLNQHPTATQECWGYLHRSHTFQGISSILQGTLSNVKIVDLTNHDPHQIFDLIETHNITRLSCTTSLIKNLLTQHKRIANVKSVAFSGEILDDVTLAMTRLMFPTAKIRNYFITNRNGILLKSESNVFSLKKSSCYFEITNNQLHYTGFDTGYDVNIIDENFALLFFKVKNRVNK